MNQRQTNLLATLAAIGTALLLLVFFIISFSDDDQSGRIVLPPDLSQQGSLPFMSPPPADLTPVPETRGVLEITRENVITIVADLKRPDNYSCLSILTLYAEDSSSTFSQRVTVLEDFQKTEYLNSSNQLEKTEIMGTRATFTWEAMPGAPLRSFATGDFRRDASARMPTYENVLALSQEEITDAVFVTFRERPCVWVRTDDAAGALSGYSIEYYVDVETGLLLNASATQHGMSAWTYTMNGLETGKVTAADFMLSSGLTAMEAQAMWSAPGD